MSQSCSYQLTRGQIFVCLAMQKLWKIMAAGWFFLLVGEGLVILGYMQGVVPNQQVITLVIAVAGVEILFNIGAMGMMYRQSGVPTALPGGDTTLEWSEAGLMASSGVEKIFVPWKELRWRYDKGYRGIMLVFPLGQFTFAPEKAMSGQDFADLYARLQEGRPTGK